MTTLLSKADVIKHYRRWSEADRTVFDQLLEAIGQPVEFYKPPRSTYIRVQEPGHVRGMMAFAFLQPGFIGLSPRVEQDWTGTYPDEDYPEWRVLDLSNRSAGRTRGAGGRDPLARAPGELTCQSCWTVTKQGLDQAGLCEDCR